MVNLIQIIGTFTSAGYLILKTEEKEKIRKSVRNLIREKHPKIIKLELERYEKIEVIEKKKNEYEFDFDDDNYEKNIRKDEINKIYDKMIVKAIDEIEKSKEELEILKSELEKIEISKKYWNDEVEKNKVKFETNAIKYAEDVYSVFEGYSRINKTIFKNKLMLQIPLPPEKFDLIYREITSRMYGIVEECYDEKNEFKIHSDLLKKPDEDDKRLNGLIVFYDEWKIKNNKLNNENLELLRNKEIRFKNIDKYGQIIQEIFKGHSQLSIVYFKKQLELKLNITDIESSELLNSLLKENTGLIEESFYTKGAVIIGSEYKFKRE